jgi:hypothetical protein
VRIVHIENLEGIMSTKRSRQTSSPNIDLTTAVGSSVAIGQDAAGAAKAVAALQERVAQLESKISFEGFDCFHVIVDSELSDQRMLVKIDHPLANGCPTALLFAQPLHQSQPLMGFGYNPQDEHWYMELSRFKSNGVEFGEFRPLVDGFGRPHTLWIPAASPEDFLKGGLTRVKQSTRPHGAGYFVAVYVPKAPIPPWVRAATSLRLDETNADNSVPASASTPAVTQEIDPGAVVARVPKVIDAKDDAKGLDPVKPRLNPAGVLRKSGVRPK